MPRKSKEDSEGSIFETKDYYLYAAELIYRYLGDRSYFIGGSIPKCKLLSIKSIQTVLRTDLDSAIQYIHNHCIPNINPTKDYKEPSVPWEVDYVLRMLYELGDLETPKRFRGGLMLLYFKFCQGHVIPDPPEIEFDEHFMDSSEIEDEYSIIEECYEI